MVIGSFGASLVRIICVAHFKCKNIIINNLHIIMSCISEELESLHILLVLIVVQDKEYEHTIALS